MSELSGKNAVVNIFGQAIIPKGTDAIRDRAFDRNKNLKAVSVPGTVKRIGDRAFADCANLEQVELAEGIESIGRNAFTGCDGLRELILPDSIRDLDGWAFYRFTGLREPAYNRSKTILYCYPCAVREKVFQVPDGVTGINAAAFLENPHLEEVILPKGLDRIPSRAFMNCGIRKLTVPENVKTIEAGAFWGCKQLREVIVSGADTVIEDGAFLNCPWDMRLLTHRAPRIDERLHLFGHTFLRCVPVEYPKAGHWRSPRFLALARRCADGDAEAMWEFADHFERIGDHPFYIYAANFWRYRTWQYGFGAAGTWLDRWIQEHPGQAMPSILNETLSGSFSGRTLHYGGFLFFDPDRDYSIERPDSDGVVQVSSWCGDDGPDEDGFGREEYYDWWYLDENLNELPGVGYVHDFSRLDKRNHEKKFQALHDAAAAAIRRRKSL